MTDIGEKDTDNLVPPIEAGNGAAKKTKARHRASIMTNILADLMRESAGKTTYVVSYLTFKEPIDPEKIIDILKVRLLSMPRFRAKYLFNGKAFQLLDESEMDFDYHFEVAFEGQKPSHTEVVDHYSNVMKTLEMDTDKPLWKFLIVPELDDGRSVIVTNISHIIGDGVSQVEVLYRMLDDEPLETQLSSRPKTKRKKQSVGAFRATRIFINGIFEGVFSVLGRPDPPNSLKLKSTSKVSREKKQAFTEKIPLAKCKQIKNKVEGATLNDVFMVLLTMMLRRYYDSKGEKPKKVRAAFPVNLRRSTKQNFDKYGSPHNIWAFGLMKFNVNYDSVIDLFRKLKKTLDVAKLSPTPVVQLKVASMLFPLLTLKGKNIMALNIGNKCTALLSNVAGPTSEVTMADNVLEDISFSLYSPLGLYLGLITYNGMLSCSVNADASIPDPEELAKHWIPAFEELYNEITSYEGIINL